METKAISVEQLNFAYAGGEDTPTVQVFENLDFSVEEGSFVAVLGRNGCGKSTLAKHFNAILLPSGGKVSVFSMDTSDEDALLDIRKCVGMVFQNPDNQIISNVVEEDVAFAPENLGIPRDEIRRRVDEALEIVGMTKYKNHAPHLLSGGQKQRIAIAGVIAMRPKCIVLDEPTAMLDPRGRREVMETIRRLNEESKITVVLITHHMAEAALADRVVVMEHGNILADGTPKEVFSQVQRLKDARLTVPETTQLLYELNQNGYDFSLDSLSVEECAQAIYKTFA
ncbi:MAG: energy-coupling factor transporter ATPase [Oscillospiraceae bacterium]|nr:energy-coupling factor transporter ATPase [Oscillospiraceae bacterium]